MRVILKSTEFRADIVWTSAEGVRNFLRVGPIVQLSGMATRMSMELTEREKAFLPYMTNYLYEKNHSVIATHFPVRHIVGQRLVDNGLLTSTEYLEICSSPENVPGSRLICSLKRKGDDSMATFYKVLVSAKGERDVDVILHCLETAADQERRSKEVSQRAYRALLATSYSYNYTS